MSDGTNNFHMVASDYTANMELFQEHYKKKLLV